MPRAIVHCDSAHIREIQAPPSTRCGPDTPKASAKSPSTSSKPSFKRIAGGSKESVRISLLGIPRSRSLTEPADRTQPNEGASRPVRGTGIVEIPVLERSRFIIPLPSAFLSTSVRKHPAMRLFEGSRIFHEAPVSRPSFRPRIAPSGDDRARAPSGDRADRDRRRRNRLGISSG